jgi:hypothetical protein
VHKRLKTIALRENGATGVTTGRQFWLDNLITFTPVFLLRGLDNGVIEAITPHHKAELNAVLCLLWKSLRFLVPKVPSTSTIFPEPLIDSYRSPAPAVNRTNNQ